MPSEPGNPTLPTGDAAQEDSEAGSATAPSRGGFPDSRSVSDIVGEVSFEKCPGMRTVAETNSASGPSGDGPPHMRSVSDVVEASLPEKDLGIRPRASELQLIWSWVAIGLMAAVVLLLGLTIWRWFDLEQELRQALLHPAQASQAIGAPDLAQYKEVSQMMYEQTWRFVDRAVLGGLMSLITLVIGYVFGARRNGEK